MAEPIETSADDRPRLHPHHLGHRARHPVFAIAVVAWALATGNAQLFKDGVDWVYDVALYGIAALVFGRDERAETARGARPSAR